MAGPPANEEPCDTPMRLELGEKDPSHSSCPSWENDLMEQKAT